ncbi:methyl-accepting chemotaxis protein [Reinekea blandensis]|uniref:Methyl-accepting chemotaxis protein n=1 Tax=Reinekea blandensis MED297 TaxID=314283 RepID=A4BA54_9GAMM|nr:methyl-accepting chemotaxis protein [Reinekea blandensis]EAR10810.1 methyl-accepting chemotaxis protein [Reinekea sp. MED297] [Reinekea blandensis MED297]
MSIRKKLLLAFVVTTLVPVLIVAVLTINRVVDEAYRDFEASSSLNMSIIDQTFTNFFDVISYNVSLMADLPAVKQTNGQSLTTYFDEGMKPSEVARQNGGREKAIFDIFSAIGENNPMLGYVYMGDVDGGYLEWPGTADYGDWDPRTRPWFAMGRDANFEIVRRDGYYWEPDDAVYVSVLKAYTDAAGDFNGVVAIDVSLKALTDMVQDIQFGDTGRIMMIEGSGNILVDGGNPENNFQPLGELESAHFNTIAQTDRGIVEFSIDGVDYQANIYQSPTLGWKFVGMMQKQEILSGAQRIGWITLIVCIVLVGLFTAGGAYLARRVVRPINEVKDSLQEMAEGEGDLTKRIHVSTQDETGELATWFNQFMESTQTMIARIKAQSEQMDRVSGHTASSASDMAAATTEQQGGIDQIATAITEMTSAANEVANNSVETANISDNGLSTTHDGKVIVNDSRESVQRLVTNIQSSNSVIQALEKETENITNILTTIQSIAEQTNLLALNAAIEAARAGEQGRGFAVVADEVRNLAQRTHDSTEEVSTILEKLIQQSRSASQAMERSATESEQTLELSQKAMQAFEAIESVVLNIRDMTTQTASATEEQHLVTKDINQNIVDINDAAARVSSLSDEVKGLCQQQTDLSHELATMVGRFKT